jgi:hypothetical protein
MTHRGLLLTMTEPPPAMEEEFNAWYDDEHMHERLSIPGFRSARRWVADTKPGEGKYLATYELDSLDVLTSPEYLARFQNQTPWSRRCLAKAVVFRRWAMKQLSPGAGDPHPAARALLLVGAESPTEALVVPEALQARHFVDEAGKPPYAGLYELAWPGLHAAPSYGAGRLVRIYHAYR